MKIRGYLKLIWLKKYDYELMMLDNKEFAAVTISTMMTNDQLKQK